jgi:glycosyltransferase involved in cell wall biosynthesis
MTMADYGICTIFAKNYLAAARVLTASFLHHHPDGRVYGLLCDRLDGYFDPRNEQFTTIYLEDLGIPELSEMICKYNILELSTAVKAKLLHNLLYKENLKKLCYFDPDILILNPLDNIFSLLDNNQIVLTPHLVEPQTRIWSPSEKQLLLVGVYNLGFIGLRKGEATNRFLCWWHEKLIEHCYADPYNGLFVDQHWVDLVPSLFDSVYILRDPGYNAAYWNLPERPIVRVGQSYQCKDRPLIFFHFSGYSPRDPQRVSKHQTGHGDFWRVNDLGDGAELFETYRQLLIQHGFETSSQWPYALNFFSNGVPVPQLARRMWDEAEAAGVDLSDPLDSDNPKGLYRWLMQPVDAGQPLINRLADRVYRLRPDVQKAFPDARGAHRRDFVHWFVTTAIKEHAIPEVFAQEMRESLLKAQPASRRLMAIQPLIRWLNAQPWGRRLLSAPLAHRIRGWLFEPATRPSLQRFVRRALMRYRTKASVRSTKPQRRPGLNIVGYLMAETGTGEVPRAFIRALQSCNYPVAITLVDNLDGARRNDLSVIDLPVGAHHDINLFAVNADDWGRVRQLAGPEILQGRLNIGYWHWELSRFPQHWYDRFEGLQEIWVASAFVQEMLSAVSPVPVVKMGVPVILHPPAQLDRQALNLPTDKFIFLYAFDMLSIPERKNPLGLIEAYRLAFGPDFAHTCLVLKANHLHRFPDWQAMLREKMTEVRGVLIEETLDRPVLNALYQMADAYVSLHRSEGFGITIAETMRMGKPVIATDYAGPRDFLNQNNGYPVRYRLVTLEKDYGPYQAGNVWADPDLEHAAWLMRHVFNDPRDARAKAQQAAQDIEQRYGPHAMAERIIQRLNRLIQA